MKMLHIIGIIDKNDIEYMLEVDKIASVGIISRELRKVIK